MMWEETPYTILAIMTAGTLVLSAFYIWKRSHVPGAKAAALLMFLGATYMTAYTLEIASSDLPIKVFGDRLQFSSVSIMPVVWLTYVFQFTGRKESVTRRNLVLLSIIPVVLILLALTNESHGLVWSRVALSTKGSLELDKIYSTGYWAFVVYSYILIPFGSVLLIQAFFRRQLLHHQRGRTVLFAVFLPLMGGTAYLIGAIPSVHPSSTLFFPIVITLIVTYIFVGWRTADIVPIAWGAVVHSIGDSVIALDNQNCIVDLNPAAQHVVGRPASALIGTPIGQAWPDLFDYGEVEGTREVVINHGKKRIYDVCISPVNDWRGLIAGRVIVARDITERKRTEEALHESEEKFRTIFEHASDEIVLMDKNGTVIDVNREIGIFGYRTEDIIGKNFSELGFVGLDEVQMVHLFKDVVIDGKPMSAALMELELKHKNGNKVFAEVSIKLIKKNSEVEGIIGIVRDITERKRVEEQIIASLKEKEVLLREIHHRVKNNLQVVSSLLHLQSMYIKDEQYKEMFEESQNRVRSMALIHENLYRSEDLANIDFEEYVRTLIQELVRSHGTNPDRIAITTEVDDVSLGVDTAIPCGLIINELVSNSLKHAFPDRKGEIAILLHSTNDSIELIVTDTGVGIPEDIDFRNTETLGLRLVTILAEDQLNGDITLSRTRGTEFRIIFKEQE